MHMNPFPEILDPPLRILFLAANVSLLMVFATVLDPDRAWYEFKPSDTDGISDRFF